MDAIASPLRRALAIPEGERLDEARWRRRHRALLAFLALHVVAVPLVGLLGDDRPVEPVIDVALLGALAAAGVAGPGGRIGRALFVTLALLAASAALVAATDGLAQAHFHFFLVVAALALYEDWRPFALAIAFVFLWLGLSAALGFAFVAEGSPWLWAGVHAGYVAALGAINLVTWRAGEKVPRDITATEERYRALVDALEEGVVVVERDGTRVAINPAAHRILGADPEAADRATLLDARGRPLPAAERPAEITWRTGTPVAGQELGVRRPDGSTSWLLVSTRALRRSPGDPGPYEVVLSFADITAQRRAVAALAETHRELERRATELERSNADLEQFAAVASHDLSEPLRMVTSYLGLLRRRYGDELGADADALIGHAVDGAARMRALIDDLLAYARVGRGEEGRRSPVDLDATVAAVLRTLEPALAEARARVEVEPLPRVAGDGPLLGQLLQNLVANALKFRGEAPPVVRIAAERLADAWRVSVADNGIGVAPEQAERIFGLFQRLHADAAYAGTGIGLAICRRIVERHGGRIWVEPTPGGGATFAFTVPDAAAAPRERTGRFEPATRAGVEAGIR